MELIRIVIIEDSAVFREALEIAINKDPPLLLLESFGMAERAIRFISKLPDDEKPEVVLLDLQLPGISGLEAIPLLRKNLPALKIIVLTQSEKETDLLEAMAQEVSGYLLKSTTSHQVLEAIHTAHQGGVLFDQKAAKTISHKLREITLNPHDTILSTREHQVLQLLAKGSPKKEISTELGISTSTVVSHTISLYKKLGATNAPSAIAKAYAKGILLPD